VAVRAALASVLLVYALIASAAERLEVAALSIPGAMQDVAFARLVGAPDLDALDFAVAIPAIYRAYEPAYGTGDTEVWCRPSDWSRLRRNEPHSGRYGALIAQESLLITYDAAKGLFRDGEGRDERNLPERFARLEAKAVRIERLDAGGVAMLLIEADIKPTERVRALYVATKQKETRMLYYLPQRPWSDADALVWGRVRDAVIAAREHAR